MNRIVRKCVSFVNNIALIWSLIDEHQQQTRYKETENVTMLNHSPSYTQAQRSFNIVLIWNYSRKKKKKNRTFLILVGSWEVSWESLNRFCVICWQTSIWLVNKNLFYLEKIIYWDFILAVIQWKALKMLHKQYFQLYKSNYPLPPSYTMEISKISFKKGFYMTAATFKYNNIVHTNIQVVW